VITVAARKHKSQDPNNTAASGRRLAENIDICADISQYKIHDPSQEKMPETTAWQDDYSRDGAARTQIKPGH